jgi:uncharacterized phage-associated protein
MNFTVMTSNKQQRPDDEKLREMILHLSDLSAQDPHFGAVKLNKLLFYADVLAYQLYGQSITGQEYQALPQGPAPRRLKPVMEKMRKAGELRTQKKLVGRFAQLRPVAGRLPNLSKFSKQENDLILRVVKRFWDYNATQISEESHFFLGWKLANHGETIPYNVVLIGNRRPTETEKRKGRALQKFARETLAGGHR